MEPPTPSTFKPFTITKELEHLGINYVLEISLSFKKELEIKCSSEIAFYSSNKINISESNSTFISLEDLPSLIEEKNSVKLIGDPSKGESFKVSIFSILIFPLNPINSNENYSILLKNMYRKLKEYNELENEIKILKEEFKKFKEENEIEVIPVKFENGWHDYKRGYQECKIIKKGKEITLTGLAEGSNFSTIITLPENCRPSGRLIFSLNNYDRILRFDVVADGRIVYDTGNKAANWISLDGLHFFAGV